MYRTSQQRRSRLSWSGIGVLVFSLYVSLQNVISTNLSARAFAVSRLLIETVAKFDAKAQEYPENIAIDSDGTIYVTLHQAKSVWKRTPDGKVSVIKFPEAVFKITGVVIDRDRNVNLAVRSDDPSVAGIWQISPDESIKKTVDLPINAGSNGMTIDQQGNLYIADDSLGRIWRIQLGDNTAQVWADDPLLRPSGAAIGDFPIPGANGIKVFRRSVYVVNSSTGNIVRIPIRPDGTAASIELPYPDLKIANADDFAFDAKGNLYVTTAISNTVVNVAPDGSVTTILSKADGLDIPTAVAFGTQGRDRLRLYITNAAFSPPSKDPQPSLQRLEVGIAGYPLPR